ncbi:MAG: hypothetical protein IT291_11320 [Deltaproteobacteria bacterium]|nr:hypothetical protein [Deltaproteobacteria bacterium]
MVKLFFRSLFVGIFLISFLLGKDIAIAIPKTESNLTEDVRTDGSSVEQLILEAQNLFLQQKSIDARSKLVAALKLAPNDYRPNMLLGSYYLGEVHHFELGHRYIEKAITLFEEQHGKNPDTLATMELWQDHARLLYLLSESFLNLDKYEQSLETLDRFGKYYWDDWFPGTKAWVLMKLKRVDEAIQIAQAGLLRGAEAGRTYNILGILLSLKRNRELSIEAFNRSIDAETLMGSLGQPATPLNNIGEVYRESFAEDLAERSWIDALSMHDGCEHILPSLNLAVLYIDELKLFKAQRVLDDFEACFKSNSLQSDSEHRTLLSLMRGRIALHMGDFDKAIKMFEHSLVRRQWFGKIGTNENDMRFAATISLAQGLKANIVSLTDRAYESQAARLKSYSQIPWLSFLSWWHFKRAREIAIDELEDFEDLYIRNTDTMIEYPTLGELVEDFPVGALAKRLDRLANSESRPMAAVYYSVYLAANLSNHGQEEKAIEKFKEAFAKLRNNDRLLKAEILARAILAQEKRTSGIFRTNSNSDLTEIAKNRESLFALLPSHLRYHDISLPVHLTMRSSSTGLTSNLKFIKNSLLSRRFEVAPDGVRPRYELQLVESQVGTTEATIPSISIGLFDTLTDQTISSTSAAFAENQKVSRENLLNEFISKTFSHKVDPL